MAVCEGQQTILKGCADQWTWEPSPLPEGLYLFPRGKESSPAPLPLFPLQAYRKVFNWGGEVPQPVHQATALFYARLEKRHLEFQSYTGHVSQDPDARCSATAFLEAAVAKIKINYGLSCVLPPEWAEQAQNFKQLLLRVSEKLQSTGGELIFVLDGLDEAIKCGHKAVVETLPFLVDAPCIRWLLAGRETAPNPFLNIMEFMRQKGVVLMELASFEQLPSGVNGFFDENMQRIGVVGQSQEVKAILLTLAWSKQALPLKTLAELSLEKFGRRDDTVETWATELDNAINKAIQFLHEHYLPDGAPVYTLYHDGLREYFHQNTDLRKDMDRALNGLTNRLFDWQSLQGFTRMYALTYTDDHLEELHDGERLWTLLNDDAFRQAQIKELKSYTQALDGLQRGVRLYAKTITATPPPVVG